MKKQVLFGIALLCSVIMSNVMASSPSVDPATYTNRSGYSLTSQWLYSNVLNNYNLAADLMGATATVRGMAVKGGKMYFASRNAGNQILVVNGTTGAKETAINLASNVFTYPGRNKANTQDSTYLTGLPCNDIKIDNAGNVLMCNLVTSNAGRFQIWKIDLTTGAGTTLIDQANLATLFPLATTMRFDAFGVWGDVTKNAVVLAANASVTAMEVYKWTITNGVVANPTLIELDNVTAGTYLTGLANLGSAPQVFPLDENLFYLDGNATFPTLMDNSGNVIDGFYNKPSALKDSVTVPGTKWTMNQGHNGVTEFQVGNDYFLLMAASNTAGVPASTFRLFKFADASKAFSGLTCLWTFPQAGMGALSNTYRTGMPCVEVNGTKANIYVYTGENGYGMYKLAAAPNAVNEIYNNNAVKVSVTGKTLMLSELVASVNVFSVTGQLVVKAKNVNSIDVTGSGVFLVKATTQAGETAIQKVIVR